MTGTLTHTEPTQAAPATAPPPSVVTPVEAARRSDLSLLVFVALGTLVLSVLATWALLVGPLDRDIAAAAEIGRRAEAAAGRTEAAVGRIEQEVGRVRARVTAAIAANLRDAVATGRPYAAYLASVEADLRPVAGAGPLLETLRRHAATGLPGMRALGDQFGAAMTDALAAETAGSEPGWAARMAGRFGAYAQYASLQMGIDAGLSPSTAALRRIWTDFTAGDLGRIDATGLSPAAARAMQPWLQAVAARQATLDAADKLAAAAATR